MKKDGISLLETILRKPGMLLLIQYPNAGTASVALESLMAAQVDGFVTADGSGNHLAAVFGSLDYETAQGLLENALYDD